MDAGTQFIAQIRAVLDSTAAEAKIKEITGKKDLDITAHISGLDNITKLLNKDHKLNITVSTADIEKSIMNINGESIGNKIGSQIADAIKKSISGSVRNVKITGIDSKNIIGGDKHSLNEAFKGLQDLDTGKFSSQYAQMGAAVRKFGSISTTETERAIRLYHEFADELQHLQSIAGNLSTTNGLEGLNGLNIDATVDSIRKLNSIYKSFGNTTKEVSSSVVPQLQTMMAKFETGSHSSSLAKMETDIKAYGNQVSTSLTEAKSALEEYRTLYNQMSAYMQNPVASGMSNEEAVQTFKRLETAGKKAANAMKKVGAEMSKSLDPGVGVQKQQQVLLYLQNNQRAAAKYGAQLRELAQDYANCMTVAEKAQLDTRFETLKTAISADGLNGGTIFDRISKGFSGLAQLVSVYRLVTMIPQAIKSMVTEVRSLDTELTTIRKITSASDAELSTMFESATKSAKNYGLAISDVLKAQTDWVRLGYNMKEAKELGDITSMFQQVGDNMTQQSASEAIISTMRGFNLDVKEATHIVDAFNNVADHMPIATDEMATALQKSASAMSAAGNTMEETMALITAANSVVQNPDRVGTAFQTISMRIRGAKSEMEEAGLDTENMLTSVSKIREEMLGLTGIDVMLDDNTFKSTYRILDELSNKWKDLTDIQQAAVTEILAGKRQGNVMSAIMQNFDIAREALDLGIDSDGVAQKELENFQKGIEYHFGVMKATFQDFSSTALNSDLIIGFVDALTKILEVATSLVDVFDNLQTVASGFALGSGLYTFIKEFSNLRAVGNIISGATDLTATAKALTDLGVTGSAQVRLLSGAFKDVGADAIQAAAGVSTVSSAVSGGGGGLGLLGSIKAFAAIHPFAAITAGVGAAVLAFVTIRKSIQEAQEAASKARYETYEKDAKKFDEDTKSLEDNLDKIVALREKLDSQTLTQAEEYSVKKDLYDIQSGLVEQYGSLASGIDLVNGSLETQISLVRSLSQEEAQQMYARNYAQYLEAREKLANPWGEGRKNGSFVSGGSSIQEALIDQVMKDNRVPNEAELEDISQRIVNAMKKVSQKYLASGLSYSEEWGRYSPVISFEGTASEAVDVLTEFESDFISAISNLDKAYDEYDLKGILVDYFSDLGIAIDDAKAIVDKYQPVVDSMEEMQLAADKTLYESGTGSKTAYDWYKDYGDAIDKLNTAIGTGVDVEPAYEAFKLLDDEIRGMTGSGGAMEQYSSMFEDLASTVNTSGYAAFEGAKDLRRYIKDAVGGAVDISKDTPSASFAKSISSLMENSISEATLRNWLKPDKTGVIDRNDPLQNAFAEMMEIAKVNGNDVESLISLLNEYDVLAESTSVSTGDMAEDMTTLGESVEKAEKAYTSYIKRAEAASSVLSSIAKGEDTDLSVFADEDKLLKYASAVEEVGDKQVVNGERLRKLVQEDAESFIKENYQLISDLQRRKDASEELSEQNIADVEAYIGAVRGLNQSYEESSDTFSDWSTEADKIVTDTEKVLTSVSDVNKVAEEVRSSGVLSEASRNKIGEEFADAFYHADGIDKVDETKLKNAILKAINDQKDKNAESFSFIEGFEAANDEWLSAIKEQERLQEGGNVNLNKRPLVPTHYLEDVGWTDVGDGIATVFSSTFSNEAADLHQKGGIAMNFTPIITDENGKFVDVLSPESLEEYANDVINGAPDDLNLKIGATFTGENAIEDAVEVAERIHELQDIVYSDNKDNGNLLPDPNGYIKNAKEASLKLNDAFKENASWDTIFSSAVSDSNKIITNLEKVDEVISGIEEGETVAFSSLGEELRKTFADALSEGGTTYDVDKLRQIAQSEITAQITENGNIFNGISSAIKQYETQLLTETDEATRTFINDQIATLKQQGADLMASNGELFVARASYDEWNVQSDKAVSNSKKILSNMEEVQSIAKTIRGDENADLTPLLSKDLEEYREAFRTSGTGKQSVNEQMLHDLISKDLDEQLTENQQATEILASKISEYDGLIAEFSTRSGAESYVEYLKTIRTATQENLNELTASNGQIRSAIAENGLWKPQFEDAVADSSALVEGLSKVDDVLAEIAEGGDVALDVFNADDMKDYSTALEEVNGKLTVNEEKLREIAQGNITEQITANNELISNLREEVENRDYMSGLTEGTNEYNSALEYEAQLLAEINTLEATNQGLHAQNVTYEPWYREYQKTAYGSTNTLSDIGTIMATVDSVKDSGTLDPSVFDDKDLLAYAEAFGIINGEIKVNEARVRDLANAKAKEQVAINNATKALQQSQYTRNSQAIKDLTSTTEKLTQEQEDAKSAMERENNTLLQNIAYIDLWNQALEHSVQEHSDWIASFNKSLETTSNLEATITSINQALNSIETGKSLDPSFFNSEEMYAYADAIEYVNGSLQLNKEKVQELTEARTKDQLATNSATKALGLMEYRKNAAEIENLKRAMVGASTTSEKYINAQKRINALNKNNEGIMQKTKMIDLYTQSLLEASGAYQRWLDAQNAPSVGDMGDEVVNAMSRINKAFELGENGELTREFGAFGNEEYQAAVEFVVPDHVSSEGQQAVRDYVADLKKYFTGDKNGVETFLQEAVEKGLVETNGEGAFRVLGEQSMQDFISAFDWTPETMQAMFGLLQEYHPEMELKWTPVIDYEGFGLDEEIQVKISTYLETNGDTSIEELLNSSNEEIWKTLGIEMDYDENKAESIRTLLEQLSGDTSIEPIVVKLDESQLSEEGKVVMKVDAGEVEKFDPDSQYPKEGTVKYGYNADSVTQFQPPQKTGYVVYNISELSYTHLNTFEANIKDINRKIIYNVETRGNKPSTQPPFKTTEATGTATVYGNAFAGGNWGIKHNTTALVGEEGRELLVDRQTGKWRTIGDNGAEIIPIKKGSIIFNHAQTEEILKRGHVYSRGMSLLNGNAFAGDYSKSTVQSGWSTNYDSVLPPYKKEVEASTNTQKTYNNAVQQGSSVVAANTAVTAQNTEVKKEEKSVAEKMAGLYDWVAVRIKYFADVTQKVANQINDYISSALKSSLLNRQMSAVQREIEVNAKAASYYKQQASAVATQTGMSKGLVDKAISGAWLFENLSEEDTEKVTTFLQYYDKFVDAENEVQSLRNEQLKLFDDWANMPIEAAEKKVEEFTGTINELGKAYDVIGTGTSGLSSYLRTFEGRKDSELTPTQRMARQNGNAPTYELMNTMLDAQLNEEGRTAKYYRKAYRDSRANANLTSKDLSERQRTARIFSARVKNRTAELTGDESIVKALSSSQLSALKAGNAVDINGIKGEKVLKRIQDYNELIQRANTANGDAEQAALKYNIALEKQDEALKKADDAEAKYAEDLVKNEQTKFKNIEDCYNNSIQYQKALQENLSSDRNLREIFGYDLEENDYLKESIRLHRERNIAQNEQVRLQEQLNEAVKSGSIKRGSQEYLEMTQTILGLNTTVDEITASIVNLHNEMSDNLTFRELDKYFEQMEKRAGNTATSIGQIGSAMKALSGGQSTFESYIRVLEKYGSGNMNDAQSVLYANRNKKTYQAQNALLDAQLKQQRNATKIAQRQANRANSSVAERERERDLAREVYRTASGAVTNSANDILGRYRNLTAEQRDALSNGRKVSTTGIKNSALLNDLKNYNKLVLEAGTANADAKTATDNYNKALDTQKEKLKNLATEEENYATQIVETEKQKFANLKGYYDSLVDYRKQVASRLVDNRSLKESMRLDLTKGDYTPEIDQLNKLQDTQIKERLKLQQQLNSAVANGSIKKGSQEYLDMMADIRNLGKDIDSTYSDIISLQDEMRDNVILASINKEIEKATKNVEKFSTNLSNVTSVIDAVSSGASAFEAYSRVIAQYHGTNPNNLKASQKIVRNTHSDRAYVGQNKLLDLQVQQQKAMLDAYAKASKQTDSLVSQAKKEQSSAKKSATSAQKSAIDYGNTLANRASVKNALTATQLKALQSGQSIATTNITDANVLKLITEYNARVAQAAVKNEDAKHATEVYNNALTQQAEALQKTKEAEAEYASMLVENEKKKLDNIQAYYSSIQAYRSTVADNYATARELKEAYGEDTVKSDYNNQIEQLEHERAALEKEQQLLRESMNKSIKSGIIEEGSQEYYEMQQRVSELNGSIKDITLNVLELQDELRNEIYYRALNKALEAAERLRSSISSINGLIKDEMKFDDNGDITALGITSLAFNVQEYESSLESLQNLLRKRKKIIDSYNGGNNKTNYNQKEFEEDLNQITSEIDSMLSTVDSARTAITNMLAQTAKAELDATLKVLDARSELLRKQKEYYDYDKTLKGKTNDLQNLDAQIRALEGMTDLESKAMRTRLELQRQQLQDDLDETVREHSYELQIAGLDDLKTSLQDNYENYVNDLNGNLKEIKSAVKDATKTVTDSMSTVDETVRKLLLTYNKHLTPAKVGLTDLEDEISVTTLKNDSFAKSLKTDLTSDFEALLGTTKKNTSVYVPEIISNVTINGASLDEKEIEDTFAMLLGDFSKKVQNDIKKDLAKSR